METFGIVVMVINAILVLIFIALVAYLGVRIARAAGIEVDTKTLVQRIRLLISVVGAVVAAERAWMNGTLEKEERLDYAEQHITDSMIIFDPDFIMSDKLRDVVRDIIDLVCKMLPHGKKPNVANEEKRE